MKRENRKVITIFGSIVIVGVAFAANASAQCSRETLQKLADTYVQAQTTGKAAMLSLAPNSSYSENNTAMDIGKGVLAGALKVDFTRSFYDTTQCASFTTAHLHKLFPKAHRTSFALKLRPASSQGKSAVRG